METLDPQHQVMRIYQSLIEIREDWGGRLVLLCGEGSADSVAAPAISVAGGATLLIDSDIAALKAAMRSGRLDFVVNTLDEALRTLKNEIRQHRPLSVGVIADLDATLAEMVERGVQPDLQLVPAGCDYVDGPRTEVLRVRGMQYRLGIDTGDGADGRAIRAMLMLSGKRHYENFFPVTAAATRAALDARLLALIPPDDSVRRHWLQRLPQFLREARGGGRWMWLSDEEQQELAAERLIGQSEQARP